MTNRKTTRRALVLSLLSLLLCCSMLVGTTFAWFTDSVTSGKNQIVAGNLDIELEYAVLNEDGSVKEWKTVNGATELFTGNLWEPGHTEVVYLKLANEGTLALKYNLGINIVSETEGTNVAGDKFKLSDYIYMGVVENAEPAYTSRADAIEAAKNGVNGIISTAYAKSGTMLADADDLYLAVVVYMPETVTNEANYKTGTARPEIDFGINLFATQVEAEADSFDINYDKNVAVFTVAEANALLAENKDAYLINCNEPAGILYVPQNYTGTLILDNVQIASVQETAATTLSLGDGEAIVAPNAEGTKIGIAGKVTVKATEEGMSAITGTKLNIFGSGHLTAIAKGKAAFGIGGMNTESVTVTGVTIDYVEGGYAYGVGTDTKYYKDAPEGGAAIGSGKDGAVITLNNTTVTKAIGGSKAAAIGARYWTGVTVNITNSTIGYAEGGVSAAAIGGSRVSSGATESGTTINIANSTITAVGGAYGAGIGSGYDTHCLSKQPLCTINIDGSTIKATGGKYAAGVGTGYHNAALTGEIKNSTVTAASGEKWYKDSYTAAMDVGFGVVDPAREGQQTDSKLIFNGVEITLGTAPSYSQVATGLYKDASGEYQVANAEGLAALNAMMADKSAGKNVVVNLIADINMTGKTWTPVDSHADSAFSFAGLNGNGHTISNLTVNGQAMFRRFAGSGDVVIKDVTFDKTTINSTALNTSILTVQTYQNVLLDNVDVKNSTITGAYKVAPLIATVYNESESTITATLKNCDVENVVVTATSYDFCTTGMVAFVYADDNDKVVFENCTVSDVELYAPNVYTAHAWVYTTGSETLFNEVEGVTVTNCTFENK